MRLVNLLRKREVKWIESSREQARKPSKALRISGRVTVRQIYKAKTAIFLRWCKATKGVGRTTDFKFSFRKRA